MGERINVTAVIGWLVVVSLLFGAAGSAARAQEPVGQDLQVLMAEAQQGVSEAQYRLGQHYEAQYDLGRTEPDAAADHTNLLLAYAWFQSAEKSGHEDARFARTATEYRLRAVFDDDEFRQATESIEEWMKDQAVPPAPQTEARSEAQTEAPQAVAAAVPESVTADAPPEASTETAAGDEKSGDSPAAAPPPDPSPSQTPDPASEAPEKAISPDIEKLLARGTSFLEDGDLVSARSFFKLAAGRGSGDAAMLVGMTYDPAYLEVANVVGLRPNPEQATAWYLKAIEMDNEEAESRLRTLKLRLGERP